MQSDNNEKVSVIVPMYKVEKYIEKCLESILHQTYRNLEVICISDASPDRCTAICKNIAEKDSRVIIIEKETNEGLAEARNTGLKAASGKYVAFVDSDDWIQREMIAVLVSEMEKNRADIVQCGYMKLHNEKLEIKYLPECKNEVLSGREAVLRLYEVPYMQPDIGFTVVWNKLYTRKVLDGIYFPKGKLFEDQFFTYKCFDRSQRIVVLGQKLYCYRDNNASITKSKYNIHFQDELEAHREQITFFEKKGDNEISDIISKRIVPLCISHFHRARYYEDIEAMKNSKRICSEMAWKYMKNPLVKMKSKCELFLFLFASETYFYYH